MLHLVNHEVAQYAKTFGCIERKTWKLLDARSQGTPAQTAAYMNEALWPSQKAANDFRDADWTDEYKKFADELFNGIEIVFTVRYVDEGG